MSNDIDPSKCKAFIDADHLLCPRCSKGSPCCEIEYVRCEACDIDNEFDEDGEPYACAVCHNEGGWWMCCGRCDEHGKHASLPPSSVTAAGNPETT